MSASQTGPSLLDFDFVYFRVISNKELLSNPNSDSLQRSKKAGEGLFTSARSDRTRGNGLHLTAQSSGHLLEGGVHAPGQAEGERGERGAGCCPPSQPPAPLPAGMPRGMRAVRGGSPAFRVFDPRKSPASQEMSS